MRLSRYVKIYQAQTSPEYRLLYSTKRTSMALLHESVLSAIDGNTLSSSQQQTLLGLGILVADADQELLEIAGIFQRLNEGRPVFTATIVLNLDCNLACTYCFEDGIKTKQYMTHDVTDRFIEHIKTLDFSRIKEVMIDFYGGEPLLSLGTIAHMSERLQKAGEEFGFRYSFRLVTNGTLLTGKTVEKLTPLGLKGAKVTLDGPEDLHNATRPFVGGKGSFNRIIANLRDVCDTIDIQVGGNYTINTYGEFPFLLDRLDQEGIGPHRVALVKFDPVVATNTPRGASPEPGVGCTSSNEEWLSETSIFLREEILKRGYRTPKINPLTCVVELKDDMVLNVDGTIYKCPGMLGLKEFAVGTIQEGTTDHRDICGLDHWKNPTCLECAYLPLCFGGCRFMNMLTTGSITEIDCRKRFFDTTLEAFINQEIRYKAQIVGPGSGPTKKTVNNQSP